jgi:uncharacterized protein
MTEQIKPVQLLTSAEQCALRQIKTRVAERFQVRRFVLFGSKARGDCHEESDVDILVLTERPLTFAEKDVVSDIFFEANLAFDTNFSRVIVDEQSWSHGLVSALPIHENVMREGVEV